MVESDLNRPTLPQKTVLSSAKDKQTTQDSKEGTEWADLGAYPWRMGPAHKSWLSQLEFYYCEQTQQPRQVV